MKSRYYAIMFQRGIPDFWEYEFAPAMKGVLRFIKSIIFLFWVFSPYIFLDIGLWNPCLLEKHHMQSLAPWFVYLGIACLISQGIVVILLFIRHVAQLGIQRSIIRERVLAANGYVGPQKAQDIVYNQDRLNV